MTLGFVSEMTVLCSLETEVRSSFKVLGKGWVIGMVEEFGKQEDLGVFKVLKGRHDFSSRGKEVTTTIEN